MLSFRFTGKKGLIENYLKDFSDLANLLKSLSFNSNFVSLFLKNYRTFLGTYLKLFEAWKFKNVNEFSAKQIELLRDFFGHDEAIIKAEMKKTVSALNVNLVDNVREASSLVEEISCLEPKNKRPIIILLREFYELTLILEKTFAQEGKNINYTKKLIKNLIDGIEEELSLAHRYFSRYERHPEVDSYFSIREKVIEVLRHWVKSGNLDLLDYASKEDFVKSPYFCEKDKVAALQSDLENYIKNPGMSVVASILTYFRAFKYVQDEKMKEKLLNFALHNISLGSELRNCASNMRQF